LERDGLAGTPDRIRERIAAFEDLGVEELIASFSSLPFVIHDRSAVELFAESVLAPARAT
jgi:alkanesulfonate monooxygenase SsuD/methylene tetrahydromethanopterin reductase-like flavin-dependent oxidoreductase (luciferase family)